MDREEYALYYPDEGQWSVAMTLREAKKLWRQFPWAMIVSLRTAEIYS